VTAGRLLAAWRLSDASESTVILAGCALACGGIAALLVTRDPSAMLLVGIAIGVGLAPIFPITVAALARALPPRIAGGLIASGGLGGAALPWIIGAASTWCGDPRCGQRVLLGACLTLMVLHTGRIASSGKGAGR
jgi:fucose permease